MRKQPCSRLNNKTTSGTSYNPTMFTKRCIGGKTSPYRSRTSMATVKGGGHKQRVSNLPNCHKKLNLNMGVKHKYFYKPGV